MQAPSTEELPRLVEHTLRALKAPIREDFRRNAIEYIDIVPKPFEVRVPLIEYFERIKRHRADAWQVDFCSRLQAACEGRHQRRTWNVVHAEGQLGKSSILAQCFPAWILGHDPMHRIALSTYNITRSIGHSKVVIGIMNMDVHRQMFPDEAGHVRKNAAVAGWSTAARLARNEAQFSYNPVGLQSGLTGSGFDTLIIDDPYADQNQAFSETVRQTLQDFWDFTIGSRISLYANVFAMFHRYHVQDLAGYLLDSGDFDYLRYATQFDGAYEHEETGQRFDDPLGRQIGEYISPDRRPPEYYKNARKNKRVWSSMFQGRPSAEEGEFFNVGKLKPMTDAEAAQMKAECSILVRAWDNAATEEGGDYSVAVLMGMKADGKVGIFDVKRQQVDSAGRQALMLETAKEDGPEVVVSIPRDPGSAGKDVVYHTEQLLKDYQVAVRQTSTSKENRARNFAGAVNSGDVSIASDEWLPEDEQWVKTFKMELRNFPLSEHDDCVDSSGDGYNECFERISKGRIIKNFNPINNLTTWASFGARFTNNGRPLDKIPSHWTIYAGVKVTANASMANSAVIVARAPQNTRLDDTLFIVAEYKEYTDDVVALFDWLDAAFEAYCDKTDNAVIWLHPDSEAYKQTIWHKLSKRVAIFEGDVTAGISELDWYLLPRGYSSPFNAELPATGMYGLIADPEQIAVATDEYGLRSARQEFATWNFTDKGEPSPTGAVLDCLRMVTHSFRTVPTGLTKIEQIDEALSPHLRTEAIEQETDPRLKNQLIQRQMIERVKVEKEINTPVRSTRSRWARR